MDSLRGSLTPHATMRGVLGGREQLNGLLREGGGGTTNYEELENLPSFNGTTVEGDHDGHYYGLAELSDIPAVVDYSINEVDTGVKWIDDKDIYMKTYPVSVTSGNVQIPLNVTVDTIVKLDSSIKKLTGGTYISCDNMYYDGGDWLNVHIYDDKIRILSSSWFNGASGYVTVYYTKN